MKEISKINKIFNTCYNFGCGSDSLKSIVYISYKEAYDIFNEVLLECIEILDEIEYDGSPIKIVTVWLHGYDVERGYDLTCTICTMGGFLHRFAKYPKIGWMLSYSRKGDVLFVDGKKVVGD